MKESIKKLRELTGFGISDCKKALEKTEGDLDKALSSLKEKGAKILEKKSGRTAKQGLIESYVHFSNNLGALVEVNCETDFVAKNEDFKKFVKDLALHVAASGPSYVSSDKIPQDQLDKLGPKEREDYIKANCLLAQPYVRDNSVTVQDQLKNLATKFKENIVIRRFSRFSLGE
jgi:elongation factor Ts